MENGAVTTLVSGLLGALSGLLRACGGLLGAWRCSCEANLESSIAVLSSSVRWYVCLFPLLLAAFAPKRLKWGSSPVVGLFNGRHGW